MKSIILFSMTLLLSSLSMVIQAADFNYNYLQLSYEDAEFDFAAGSGISKPEVDGFGLVGSAAITDNIFLTGTFSTWDGDYSVDADTWMLGGGYHSSLMPNTDLVLEASLGNLDMAGITSKDFDIWSISGGLRHMVNPQLEIAGKLGVKDFDNKKNTDSFFQASAVYEFKKDIAGVISYEAGESIDLLTLAARVYF